MTDHAVYNFSASARGLACPASWRIVANMPVKDKGGDAASEGTKVHGFIEYHIKNGISSGEVKEGHQYQTILETFLGFIEQLGDAKLSESEMKVRFKERPSDAFGTLDYAHIPANSDNVWTVVDYKNGAWDVPAADNKQMLSYAAALIDSCTEFNTKWLPRWFRLVIVQPNSFADGDAIKQWACPVDYVIEHKRKMLDAINRAEAGEAPKQGPHCRWCPAFGNCPATQDMLPFLTEAVKLPAHAVPDEAIIRLLQILRGLTDYKKGLDAELVSRLAAGRSIDGARISLTRPHRQWADPAQAAQQLFATYQSLGIEPVSPAKAEKLGQAGKDVVKSLAVTPTGQPKAEY